MTGIIILAAGASTRMGNPKQLLLYQEGNLLQHAIRTALGADFYPVIVVLGANVDKILPITDNGNIILVKNEEWAEGLGSSVRAGVKALMEKVPEVENALLMLCDQPFVTSALLKRLVQTKAVTDKKIIASMYNNIAGVPVLFDASFFPELLKLQGQDGAKKLLSVYGDEVAVVPFPEGAIDIDTPNDYEQLFTT